MSYAERLTREQLEKSGITNIDANGNVYRNGELITPTMNNSGYYVFNIYRLDENDEPIKRRLTRTVSYKKKDGSISKYIVKDTYIYEARLVTVHRATYAWWNGEATEGMVVDHFNNDKTDNNIFNLIEVTPSENLCKGTNKNKRELKCKLNKPREFYENRLALYLELYEIAKKEHNAKEAHKQRANIANIRARLRYYDSHKA